MAFAGPKTREIESKRQSDNEHVRDEELVEIDEDTEADKVSIKPDEGEDTGDSVMKDQSDSLQDGKQDVLQDQEAMVNGDSPVSNLVRDFGHLMLIACMDNRQTDHKERSASRELKCEVSIEKDKIHS